MMAVTFTIVLSVILYRHRAYIIYNNIL